MKLIVGTFSLAVCTNVSVFVYECELVTLVCEPRVSNSGNKSQCRFEHMQSNGAVFETLVPQKRYDRAQNAPYDIYRH